MADSRSHAEEEHDGASPGEQLIEAARRNNTDLLQEVIDSCASPEKAAILLNETKSVLGNYLYHEAALRGNYEVIDLLLDQDGFECDPISRIDGDTPLHSAVRYINTLPLTPETSTFASELISMMIEAGSDARLRNKAQLTAAHLVDPSNTALKRQLEDAVEISQNHGDFIVSEGRDDFFGGEGVQDEDDDYAGSASDSDFDPEEYKREKEKRKREAAATNGKD